MILYAILLTGVAVVAQRLNEIGYDVTGAVLVETRDLTSASCVAGISNTGEIQWAAGVANGGSQFDTGIALYSGTRVTAVLLIIGDTDCAVNTVGTDLDNDDDDVLDSTLGVADVLSGLDSSDIDYRSTVTTSPVLSSAGDPLNSERFFLTGTGGPNPLTWYHIDADSMNDEAIQDDGTTRSWSTFTPPINDASSNLGFANGDPHLQGANGEKYVLKGERGKVYNLLSSPSFNVNFDLFHEETPADSKVHYGLFMKTLGITVQGHYFELSRDRFPDVDALNAQLQGLEGVSVEEVSHVGLDLLEPITWRRFGIQRFLRVNFCPDQYIVVEFVDNRVDVLEIVLPRCHDEFDGAVGATFQCQYVEKRAKWEWNLRRERSFIVPSLKSVSEMYSAEAKCGAPIDTGAPLRAGRQMSAGAPLGVNTHHA